MEGPIVHTKHGIIQGVFLKNIDGETFFGFKGIPYAKPPIGKLRFCDPLPPESWTGIREAYNFKNKCAQYDGFSKNTTGSDDCLYLNVYTKKIDIDAKQPVLFWIHGGGFVIGQGDDILYGPDYFLRKNLVLVTINYRLGVFGFLNLQHRAAPGNQGLKDQVMALKWVKENIINFGGNPENITIMGGSAGAACVHYLCLSPLSRGLMRQAIMQSGTCTSIWAFMPNTKEYAYRLCKYFGRDIKDPVEIVTFLRTIDAQKLAEGQLRIRNEEILQQYYATFLPGIDNESDNPFLPTTPEELAQNGIDIPLIIGHNVNDGLIMLTECTHFIKMNFSKKIEELFKLFQSLPHPKLFERLDSDFPKCFHNSMKDVWRKFNLNSSDIRHFEFGSDKIAKETSLTNYVTMMSNLYFNLPVHEAIRIQVERSPAPTYMYQFTYDKGFSLVKKLLDCNIKGSGHFDETGYLFNARINQSYGIKPHGPGTREYRVMDQMTEMWYNFAKTGCPTPKSCYQIKTYWQPVSDDRLLRCLIIDEHIRMGFTINLFEQYSFKKYMKIA